MFCTVAPAELKELKNVSSSIQTQLDHKPQSDDYVTTSTLSTAEAELDKQRLQRVQLLLQQHIRRLML